MARRLSIKIVKKGERCERGGMPMTIETDEGKVHACVRGYRDTEAHYERLIRAADKALALKRRGR